MNDVNDVSDVWERTIDSARPRMVAFLRSIVALPAISPEYGGEGEWKKAERIREFLVERGFSNIEEYPAPDPRTSEGTRPNLVIWHGGLSDSRRVLTVVHMDVVPPGDEEQWTGDPFTVREEGGRLIGRGVEDNGQSLTASLFALDTLRVLDLTPPFDVGVVLVSDEEASSEKGIKHLIRQGFFRKDDIILVPDGGNPQGSFIEVAEKSLIWVKVITRGVQCHASRPDQGVNAFRASSLFLNKADTGFRTRFPLKDGLFLRPYSTFEPTMKEANVPNINTLPGEDVFYIDCRLLPQYSPDEAITFLREVAVEVGATSGVTITVEPVLVDEASDPTPEGSTIVVALKDAIRTVYNSDPTIGGVSSGTCAGILRKQGYQAAVWQRTDGTAHSPDEYCILDNLTNDCKVMTHLYMSGTSSALELL